MRSISTSVLVITTRIIETRTSCSDMKRKGKERVKKSFKEVLANCFFAKKKKERQVVVSSNAPSLRRKRVVQRKYP